MDDRFAGRVRQPSGQSAHPRLPGVPAERCHGNIRTAGNTASASVPLAMVDASFDNGISPGSRALLTAFGGGLTWGSATLTWPDCKVADPRTTG
ncbi:3-oxoacyl-[acyl-carrier-protein] synthase III C-terminal domain-containing protein [Streptomyces monashensis]|uniref:3-oxoacyl-[acyl-carrier-protein] synthase III C-terminal domain-containing protein n=1 Tax=Streptomyces monashensis TaxID=1678012 RepID=UPI001FE9893B|nr:3-oxoacyl-[acyl-carrier-protein] synthase III C-terminal domain-containing protein [Streptomyces monashensis]